MEKIDLKKGKYLGLVTRVAEEVGKPPSNTYAAIFYTRKINREKEVFVRIKTEIDQKDIEFQNAISKAV
jgi:hypothetical protein